MLLQGGLNVSLSKDSMAPIREVSRETENQKCMSG